MPLTSKGKKIMRSMKKEYGPKKGEKVFYASRNKGTISGVEKMKKGGHVIVTGKQCDECGSWRQDKKYHPDRTEDLLFCYACKSWNELKIEKLMSKLI